MSSVSVKFVGFWPSFDVDNNKFVDALRSRHSVEVIPTDSAACPDILFYSRCGNRTEHLAYDCVKVYYTGENDCPDFNQCDYALSFYPLSLGDRHLRYPLYMLYEYDRLSALEASPADAFNRDFCSLLMRNASNCDPRRLRIIDLVESYRPIAYGGPFRNNVGGCVEDKIAFISAYKFNLALENSKVEGYVTEKILEPLVARTVPVYWGSDMATKDFNPDAFINVDDYASAESFLQKLQQIDSDPAAYLSMLSAPPLRADRASDFDSQLADFLDNIASNLTRYVSSYGEQHYLASRNSTLAKLAAHDFLYKVCKKLF